jgi:hypothetical protein
MPKVLPLQGPNLSLLRLCHSSSCKMVIGQALVLVDLPTGPVYSGVVASEPWEAEDDTLIFSEVSYLQSYSLMVVGGL